MVLVVQRFEATVEDASAEDGCQRLLRKLELWNLTAKIIKLTNDY